MNVTVVTVTYGKRLHLLTQVLHEARAQGAANAVVIDNGALDPVADTLAARFGNWVYVHVLGRNTGSAMGFKAGISQAMQRGAEAILLLDDDNMLVRDCLSRLVGAWHNAAACHGPPGGIAVHAVRTAGDMPDVKSAPPINMPRKDSFLGFHLADVPAKLFRRIAPGLSGRKITLPITEIDFAPYGGLLLHRDAIARIGLPDEAFFLYTDDYEYTARLTRQAGKILLVNNAFIRDIDTTWGAKNRPYSTLFSGRLDIQNLSKLYYATRNLVYFETYIRRHNGAVHTLNRAIFWVILTILALRKGNFRQFKTMLIAVNDGSRKIRGMNTAYLI